MKIRALVLLLLSGFILHAQESPVQKFGKIKPEDFAKKVYSIDSNAAAIVLFDVGSAEIVGNTKGWFSVEYRHHKRIHILNKNGYDNADVSIAIYNSSNGEVELENLKAVTYNLVDGKMVETKLEKSAVFKEKLDKEYSLKKFTLPNIKEGSIIEYEYKISSDFIHSVKPWTFQGSIPVLWSDFTFAVPQFLNYVFLSQGFHPIHLNNQKNRAVSFNLSEANGSGPTQRYSFNSGVTEHRWVMKDIPQLKEEGFTSTLDNYLSRIEFQLSGYSDPLTPKNIMGTWPLLTQSLLENEYFGGPLKNNNGFLSDVVKPLVLMAKTDEEKARNIYNYVRDNFTCTDHDAVYMDQSLREVLKTKKGNVSELNLLLTAMLKNAGLQAEPVILSTSENGLTYTLYPLIRRFNYVISRVVTDKGALMLDATHPRLGFGKLVPNCYNGQIRVVNTDATIMHLSPDSLLEKSMTSMFVVNNDQGKWIANARHNTGYYQSYNIREKIKEKGKESFFKEMQKEIGNEITITDPSNDSLDNYDQPLSLKFQFAIDKADEDLLYINPMFGEGYTENPFKSAERLYPVEMPFAMDKTYLLTMQVPDGYVLDELPKPMAVKLNEEGDGYFEYMLSKSDNTISLRSRIKIKKTFFNPEEYDFLREFFQMVVTKHNEQIVFKKKANP